MTRPPQQVILKRDYPPYSKLEKTLKAVLYVAAAAYWLHEKFNGPPSTPRPSRRR